MKTAIYLDRFSAGLDDLTRKQQSDPVAVLRVLARTGRYSVFEATDNDVIARTMTRLHHKACSHRLFVDQPYRHYGRLIQRKGDGGAYPWTAVELTEGGKQLLADADAAELGEAAIRGKGAP